MVCPSVVGDDEKDFSSTRRESQIEPEAEKRAAQNRYPAERGNGLCRREKDRSG